MLKKINVFFSSRKHDQYRFSWYLPLAGLKLHWAADEERSPEVNIRLHTLRTKLFFLRQQLQQNTVRYHSEDNMNEPLLGQMRVTWSFLCTKKGTKIMALAARNKKKLEQMELMLLTYSPVYRLELHSPSGKVHKTHAAKLFKYEWIKKTRIIKERVCFVAEPRSLLLLPV